MACKAEKLKDTRDIENIIIFINLFNIIEILPHNSYKRRGPYYIGVRKVQYIFNLLLGSDNESRKSFSVDKKTVLITGGSRGIGEMIASGFCANGAKVYITARSEM